MKRATVVIGANWGDCAKGLVTDWICSRLSGPKVCVRHNGGSQAGHTVVTPEGKRHVFHHFGSGTLAGADTYLAKHFVCNPLLFWKEAKELAALGVNPVIAADPRCYITTPYDMLVNQSVEEARGKNRHGSVGVGFGETIERNMYPAFRLCQSDLTAEDKVKQRLRIIRDKWLPIRCQQLGIKHLIERNDMLRDELLDKTAEAFFAFNAAVKTAGAEFLDGKSVVFEGAQGLALDMNSKNFPHVTRSNTGLTNVLPIARIMGYALDVLYVTRTYLTKHGAGQLPGECPPWSKSLVDETNSDHPFQGRLRYAPLSVPDMLSRISEDRLLLPRGGTARLAVTCLDQNDIPWSRAPMSVALTSHGPRRDMIECHE